MASARWIISTAPEIFLLLAVAIGTMFGRVKVRGFSIGTTACTLIVAVLIGRFGPFTFPPVLRAMTVDAAVTGCCEIAESQTPVLGVAVPYAVGNVVLTVLGPIIVACTFVG